MEKARITEARGAFGLKMPDGGKEMIDEPMLKQVSERLRVLSFRNKSTYFINRRKWLLQKLGPQASMFLKHNTKLDSTLSGYNCS